MKLVYFPNRRLPFTIVFLFQVLFALSSFPQFFHRKAKEFFPEKEQPVGALSTPCLVRSQLGKLERVERVS
jgi:hypothetical protein